MKIIKPSVMCMHTGMETTLMEPEKFIERVGRTCYKSEGSITDSSAAAFVSHLIKRGHEAMIEHWNYIFQTDGCHYEEIKDDLDCLMHELDLRDDLKPMAKELKPFLRFTAQTTEEGEERYIVSGNIRAWRDFTNACVCIYGFVPIYLYGLIRTNPLFFPEYQNWVPINMINDILFPITEKDLMGRNEHLIHHTVTLKFICDRGVSHEIVRHRTASFAQESTRYCNYSADKYGSEITVIEPAKFSKIVDTKTDRAYTVWKNSCFSTEKAYFDMLYCGCSPQEARAVLNNSLKTELIMTGTLDCWNHFFNLRCAPDAHPDIQVVAKLANETIDDVWAEIETED